ncbi:nitroreductase/quinone reductase family protein [Rhodococcus sp. USK13]|uniref:nitroreductase/quinone reductase family protein n=1 Tax=Rhodococcus sp. USK13 TaxID=2806442 RepID=UPI001BCB245F|nr:nitroreductase/quinone reductase family protein [Rhodococcus sp. USK13]
MAELFVNALRLHPFVYERSGGWLGHRLLFGVPTLLLHTVGRKSGAPRTSALTYGRDGDDYRPGDPDYDRMWATMNDINSGRDSDYQKKTTRPYPL